MVLYAISNNTSGIHLSGLITPSTDRTEEPAHIDSATALRGSQAPSCIRRADQDRQGAGRSGARSSADLTVSQGRYTDARVQNPRELTLVVLCAAAVSADAARRRPSESVLGLRE